MEIETWLRIDACRSKVLNRLKKFNRPKEWCEDIWGKVLIKCAEEITTMHEIKNMGAWLSIVAINMAMSEAKSKRSKEVEFHEWQGATTNDTGESALSDKSTMQAILRVVKTMPKRQRQAFELRFIDELAFIEIAEIMNCTRDTAKSHYRHALKGYDMKFKKLLGIL